MLSVPRELWPSLLLWLDHDEPFVEELRRQCEECYCTGRTLSLTDLDAWRKRADELLTLRKDNSCALVLIHLADQYRWSARPSQALDCNQKAEQTLSPWTREENQYNRAVAQYALGLALEDQALGMQALNHHNEALKGFRGAREWWDRQGNALRVKRCDETICWIQQRRKRLSALRPPDFSPGLQVQVPVVGRIAAGEPMLAREEFEEWILVEVDRARRVSFALRVKGDSMIDAGIKPDDLVLIEENPSVPTGGETVAVIIEGFDTEATLKKCYKEVDHYRLEPANKNEPFRILKKSSVPEGPICARYPGREIKFYPKTEPRVVGWMRGVISGTGP
jgi:SOS-response transcriptional repressor LexA